MLRCIHVIALLLALGGSLAACAKPALVPEDAAAVVSATDLAAIIPKLADKRAVYVGEQHDRYDHHLNELAIIRGIHALQPGIAIGMEMFPQPDQPALDAYIARQIDETEMRRRTRLDWRWRAGFRQYAPILRFARDQGIPIIALNAADELVEAVRTRGIDGLDAEARARLPAIDRSDAGYRRYLQHVYAQHGGRAHGDSERFIDVQLLWDESMAERLAQYLRADPARRVVVLAGNGHVAYSAGIPQRLHRRIEIEDIIVVQGADLGLGRDVADYVLLSDPVPPPGAP